jgi:hypothetical protein
VSQDLLIVGVVLVVVVFAVVPIIVDDVVPTVVDGVLKSVERVAMAFVNRLRPADALSPERIKQLQAEVASLSASVERLSATERELVERLARGDSGNSRENEKSLSD